MLATESDATSLSYARRNVSANNLEHRIKILTTASDATTPLIPEQIRNVDKVDFLMVNPPFYTSKAEMISSAKAKKRPPNSACTGSESEMICPGGEVAFVGRLVDESQCIQNKRRVQWFSSMLGKLSSVSVVVEKVREAGCDNWCVSQFVQGETRRWVVAWSWGGWRPEAKMVRGTDAVEKRFLCWGGEFGFEVKGRAGGCEGEVGVGIAFVKGRVNEMMESIECKWRWRNDVSTGVAELDGDTWSRKARRRAIQMGREKAEENDKVVTRNSAGAGAGAGKVAGKVARASRDKTRSDRENAKRAAGLKQGKAGSIRVEPGSLDAREVMMRDANEEGSEEEESKKENEPAMAIRISLKAVSQLTHQAGAGGHINVRCLRGEDSVLFESFCGWFKRKLTV